jgi:hypothetical protein
MREYEKKIWIKISISGGGSMGGGAQEQLRTPAAEAHS